MSKTLFTIPPEYISRISPRANTLPKYRNDFMRDRDRIMYCTAFRRLAGKTQIYTIGSDDHKKNRLTHSLEVAQIARTISLALGLNEELAEAIALGHDLGHTPFGHAGESTLHSIMCPKSEAVKDSPFYHKEANDIWSTIQRESTPLPDIIEENSMFGFKHNIQSVRVASILEDGYRGINGENIGLNLTNYTLWGMLHHSKIRYDAKDLYPNYQNQFSEHINIRDNNKEAWSFEAYIVEWADDIAQWHHDLEDAVRGDALPIGSICYLITEAFGSILSTTDKKVINSIQSLQSLDRKSLADLSHIVVNTLITNLVETSTEKLHVLEEKMAEKYPNKSIEEKARILFLNKNCLEKVSMKESITLSEEIKTSVFKETIRSYVHHSKDVERMNAKGQYIIKKLFEAYNSHPQQLPDGVILHFMVDIGKYETIEKARLNGMGIIRTEFGKMMENPKTVYRCQLMRRICDHIACMTDRYAIEEYNNLYG